MRIKTIFLLAMAIVLTVLMLQNNEQAKFNFLFFSGVYISKLSVLLFVAITSFVAGIAIAKPRKYKIDTDRHNPDDEDETSNANPGTLSDEDRDYIS